VLGATSGEVRRLVLRQGMQPVAAGVALHLLGSAAVTGYMKSLLFGVSANDPWTFGAVRPCSRASHSSPVPFRLLAPRTSIRLWRYVRNRMVLARGTRQERRLPSILSVGEPPLLG
jgi:hypothetical protein